MHPSFVHVDRTRAAVVESLRLLCRRKRARALLAVVDRWLWFASAIEANPIRRCCAMCGREDASPTLDAGILFGQYSWEYMTRSIVLCTTCIVLSAEIARDEETIPHERILADLTRALAASCVDYADAAIDELSLAHSKASMPRVRDGAPCSTCGREVDRVVERGMTRVCDECLDTCHLAAGGFRYRPPSLGNDDALQAAVLKRTRRG